MSQRLYADHNATSPLRPQAREAMARVLDIAANPSSVHAEGRRAKRIMEDARETVAGILLARPSDVTFTCGATEALHLALASASGCARVVIGATEHDAVWAEAHRLWPECVVAPVGPDGVVDLHVLDRLLAAGSLLVLQAANNETGVLQPLDAVADLVRRHESRWLCDAAQACGKLAPQAFGGIADWTVVSSHKLGGPAGVGALIVQCGAPIRAAHRGGGQESGARPGTENVAAVAGFAAALEAAEADRERSSAGAARDGFEAAVRAADETLIVAASAPRLPNTSMVVWRGWDADRQVMALDLAGAAISAGAACSSGKVKSSRTLAAMGFGDDLTSCASRASFGWTSAVEDGAALARLYLHAAAARRPALQEA